VAFPRTVVSFSSQSEMILRFFSVECAEGDGPPKNSDWITENPLGFPTFPPALVVVFNFEGRPLKLRLTVVDSEEAAPPATAKFHLPSPWQRANVCYPKSFDRSTRYVSRRKHSTDATLVPGSVE